MRIALPHVSVRSGTRRHISRMSSDLVAAADALHVQAAQLNKEGRFVEAKAAYAAYQAALTSACTATNVEDVPTASARLWAAAQSCPVVKPSRLAARSRVVGAVVGAACADAASMGLHWVYDLEKLAELVGDGSAAFHEPPADAFYSYPAGSPSPYGQQALALLHSLVETRGFSPAAYAARNFEAFTTTPCYLDGSTRGFISAVQSGAGWPGCGVDDSQANCVARLPPLVAALAGDPALLPAVSDMLRVTQESEVAVAWGTAAARVLEGIILGATPHDAVHATIDALREPECSFRTAHDAEVADAMVAALALSASSPAVAVTTLGRNCHLPGCFQAPIHALVCAAPAYETAVTDTILAGGCNASRAGFIGACLGAHLGYNAVPSAWRAKFTLFDETLRHAEALAALRE